MLRLATCFLLGLLALALAGSAGAHVISVVGTDSGTSPSDMLVLDVMLDTEGVSIYGFGVYVDFDPAHMSVAPESVRNPIPGEEFDSFYLYPNSWYIWSFTLAPGGLGPVNQSIATLVFHVIEPLASTWVAPNFDYGPYGSYIEYDGSYPMDVTGQVVLNAWHEEIIPEPTTGLLVACGLLGLAVGRQCQRPSPRPRARLQREGTSYNPSHKCLRAG